MQLNELRLVSASNIIKLRTGAGMTQAELGAALNYSDKTISKWERGEAIPDAFVLTRMAELFDVPVDYILSAHDDRELPQRQDEPEESTVSKWVIIAIAFIGVWTLALAVFVILWISGRIIWRIFLVAMPLSIVTYMVLTCVFRRTKHLQYIIAVLVLSIFVMLYALFPNSNPWQLFLIAVPAEVIVFLSCNIKNPHLFRKLKKKDNKRPR